MKAVRFHSPPTLTPGPSPAQRERGEEDQLGVRAGTHKEPVSEVPRYGFPPSRHGVFICELEAQCIEYNAKSFSHNRIPQREVPRLRGFWLYETASQGAPLHRTPPHTPPVHPHPGPLPSRERGEEDQLDDRTNTHKGHPAPDTTPRPAGSPSPWPSPLEGEGTRRPLADEGRRDRGSCLRRNDGRARA